MVKLSKEKTFFFETKKKHLNILKIYFYKFLIRQVKDNKKNNMVLNNIIPHESHPSFFFILFFIPHPFVLLQTS